MEEIFLDGRTFNPAHTFECGQVFRYGRVENRYYVLSRDKCAVVKQAEDGYAVESSDPAYFRNYFDLGTDYGKIIGTLSVMPLMKEAAAHGSGIRILRQDRFETLVSFLISQNNHIARIKSIIARLCGELGERVTFRGKEFRSFPSPEALAARDADYYYKQGLGYRAPYLADAARLVAEGFDLAEVDALGTYAARKKLLSVTGVGPKVADCILLFAFNRMDVFPVDTWMEKVYYDYFEKKKASTKQITDYFVGKFGRFSGYAQQYLFYYKRELNKED